MFFMKEASRMPRGGTNKETTSPAFQLMRSLSQRMRKPSVAVSPVSPEMLINKKSSVETLRSDEDAVDKWMGSVADRPVVPCRRRQSMSSLFTIDPSAQEQVHDQGKENEHQGMQDSNEYPFKGIQSAILGSVRPRQRPEMPKRVSSLSNEWRTELPRRSLSIVYSQSIHDIENLDDSMEHPSTSSTTSNDTLMEETSNIFHDKFHEWKTQDKLKHVYEKVMDGEHDGIVDLQQVSVEERFHVLLDRFDTVWFTRVRALSVEDS